MGTLLIGAAVALVIYLGLQLLRTANPARLARLIKIAGGVLSLAMAAFVGVKGQLAVAIPLGFFGAGLLGWAPMGSAGFGRLGGMFGGGAKRSPGQTSRVKSGYLDMALDHETGQLSGSIVAGQYAGRNLDEFDLPQLLTASAEFDAESVVLLESYLDRRFPVWRQHAQGEGARRETRASSSGKMTNEEAYQILGVQPGASRSEISAAHRALMKKLHPDQGGSTYLAARVNEAKDTLLRTHLN